MSKFRELQERDILTLKALVAEQAGDHALWLLDPTVTEAYILQALRDLHAAIEELGHVECSG